MATAMMENNLNRALELLGGSIDPEIEESYASIEARILAQALENVELAEQRLALANELASTPQKSVANAAEKLSSRYRSSQSQTKGAFLHSRADGVAYAAYRLPATFAAIYAALNEARKRRPDWHPRSMLDSGSGPGTALWAASELWPELGQVTLIDGDDGMVTFGKQIAIHPL